MKKLLLAGLAVLIAAVLAAIFLDPDARLLGWLRGESFFQGRATSAWRAGLRSETPSIQLESATALKNGGPGAVPVLIELLQTPVDAAGSAHVRWTAAELLGKIQPEAVAAIPDLIEALKDPDPHVRIVTITSLGAMTSRPAEVVPALISMLNTPQRLGAIRALSRFRHEASPAIKPLLVLFQNDPDVEVRWNAARTLGKMGPAGKEAVPQLIDGLKSKEDLIREHAAEALGDIGSEARAAVNELAKTLRDPVMKVRRDAARSLGQIGAAAKPALSSLRECLQDSEAQVRAVAAKSMKQIDPDIVIPPEGK
jgi:HEAT repeat protein